MGNFTQGTNAQLDIIWMRNYTIRIQKITKLKHEDVGLSKLYQINQINNASRCPSFQKYLKEKLGNTLRQHRLKQKINILFSIKKESHQYSISSFQKPRRARSTTKLGQDMYRSSCSMVGYPLVDIIDMDNKFDIIHREIWWEEAN